MKKIIRIATVSALASVALLFAGCTKDYSADINALNDQVSALSQKVESLQAAIDKGSVITDVTATTNGIKVTLSNGNSYEITNGKDGANGKDGTNGTNGQDGKDGADGDTIYYRPDVDKNLWIKVTNGVEEETEIQVYVPGTTTAVWDTVNGTLKISNVQKNDGTVGTVTINLGSLLSSLVFCPDLYFEGIEAMAYDYANPSELEKTKAFESCSDDQGATAECSVKNYVAGQGFVSMPSLAIANYYVNPKNVDVNAVNWGFSYMDRNVVTRSTAGSTSWTPVFKSISEPDKTTGLSEVTFEIKNGKALTSATEGAPVSVLSLYGEQKDSTIHSDFAAIAPFQITLKAIAFEPNTYKAADCGMAAVDYKFTHLYESIEKAVTNTYSVPVQYNKGQFPLDFFEIHILDRGNKLHTSGTSEKSYSLSEFQKKFPGSELKFELVKYTLGDNDTDESKFGIIEGTNFYPCYAEGKGDQATSVKIPKGSETKEGKSAILRKPIVCVTLNYNEKVVLAGYFKISIAEEVIEPTSVDPIFIEDFPDLGTFPYICAEQSAQSKWVDWSSLLLEKLKYSYEEFKAEYTWDGNTYDITRAPELKDNVYKATTDFGRIEWKEDTGVGAINDRLELYVSKPQADKVGTGKSKSLYAKFVSNKGGADVYIKLTFAIAMPAEYTFGEKIPTYWFDNVVNKVTDVFKMNVKVPNQYIDGTQPGDDDVKEFYNGMYN